MTRRFRLLAGPNGSGKTTLKRRLEHDYAVNFYDFLNADEIYAEVKATGVYAPRLTIEPEVLAAYVEASSYDKSVKAFFRKGAIAVEEDCVRFKTSDSVNSYTVALLTAFETSAEAASREAVKEAFAAGLPITVLQDGRIVRLKEGAA